MRRYAAGALGALLMAGTAQATPLTPTEIINRHMAAVQKRDVDAIVADYADDAVTLQANGATQGKAAIRALFEGMFGSRPATTPAGAPAMKVTKVWEEGNVGFVTWEFGPMMGKDEFLVRDGKIAVQAVFMSGAPRAPSQ